MGFEIENNLSDRKAKSIGTENSANLSESGNS